MERKNFSQEQIKLLKTDYDLLLDKQIGYTRTVEQINRHPENVRKEINLIQSMSVPIHIDRKMNETQKHQALYASYPSSGLIETSFDNLDSEAHRLLDINEETVGETIAMRYYFLILFNHPYRINALTEANEQEFIPPPPVECTAIKSAEEQGIALSINDLGSTITGGTKNGRMSRSLTLAARQFIKLGKQARIPFVGSESPDVWGSTIAVATMAACNALTAIPRNGALSDIQRQVDFAKEVFAELENIADIVLENRSDKQMILEMWKNNVIGTVEPSKEKALKRAEALIQAGVRGLRPYSPEPGDAIINTTKSLRERYGDEIEIIPGQIVDVDQAMAIQEFANAIVLGVAGGGRCITGLKSGVVVDWPHLLYHLRGKLKIATIVQGGGSDDPATTLLLGASGIGVSRMVPGGTIESPGGFLYCIDKNGNLCKPYGGEASERTKLLDGKLLPFNIASFPEGETTWAYPNYLSGALPTMTLNLYRLLESSTLAQVFKMATGIQELHAISPSPIRRITEAGRAQRKTH
jgi:hypothetical protein